MSGNRRNNKFALILQVIFALNVIFIANAQAQNGNEWIVSGQSYFKLPVGRSGIYALTFTELGNAGVPASFFNTPQNMQLFHRGVEQAVYINNDSLVFYGEKNDGTLDSLLYKTNIYQPLIQTQPHKYYNLYSDTSAYFLTWSASTAGKRMAVSNLSTVQSPDAYHTAENLLVLTDEFDQGYKYSSSTYMTTGDQGEGWFGPALFHNPAASFTPVDQTYPLTVSSLYSSGPQANLEVMLVGRNGDPNQFIHVVDILIGNPGSPDMTFSVPAFTFHDVKVFKGQIPLTYLQSGTLNVTVRLKGNGGLQPSMISVAYIKLNYPQTYNMLGNSEMYFNSVSNASLTNIEISNPASGSKIFDISDKNNVQLVNGNLQGGLLKTTLSASALGHSLFISSPTVYRKPSTIKLVDLSDYSNFASADYIIITNYKIIAGARDYASYRASNAGGTFDTLIADVDKLYNMYSYGERTPVAIKRFVTHLINNGNPKYLFIIGKGLTLGYAGSDYRRNPIPFITNTDPFNRREDLVPCYGIPCSDLLYSMTLDGSVTQYVPRIPTGRLSAKTDQEVRNYLSKVVEHESPSNSTALWRKHLIHLSGGHEEGEKISFYNNVVALKQLAESPVFSGKVVKIFSKKGNDAVDNELISSVADEINKGVSYVTFFGHSSPGVTDLDIGWASEPFYGYHNQGKYPMLVINGCASAQMFARWSFSEDWILTPGKGAILTMGHTDAGYAQELLYYSTKFYENAFNKPSMAGKPIGDVQVGAIQDFNSQYGFYGPIVTATMQQMVLQGDPGIKVYAPKKPDYETDDNKVSIKSFDGDVVTAVSDSFAISIVVANLGINLEDSLEVTVKRLYNGKVVVYGPVKYKPVSYEDTLIFVIKSQDATTYGENVFDIYLDPNDSIPELDEMNNHATLRYFIPLSGVTCIFPKEYSIVNVNTIDLVAQSTNLLIANRDYYFEIDTSYSFNSPKKMSSVVNAGFLVRWKNLTLPVLQDSLVYYWRVRYDQIGIDEDTLWGESSFIYIFNSEEGWSQSEFPQFYKDNLNKVERNKSLKKWEFAQSESPIYVKVVGTSYPSAPLFPLPYHNTSIRLNGLTYEFRGGCLDHSLFAIKFDKSTAVPHSPYEAADGGVTCGIRPDVVNYFDGLYDGVSPPNSGSEQNQANLMAYIDSVSTGDYVLLGNTGDAYFDNWTPALKNKIKTELGAKFLDSLKKGSPYILLARKGDPNPIFEKYDSLYAGIVYNDTILGTNNKGFITSTLIGPSDTWGHLYRKVQLPDPADHYELKIIGIDLQGNNVDTLSIVQKDSLDLSTVNTLDQYPYIRLLAEVEDVQTLTPPQLTRWQVIYKGVPEGTMDPSVIGLSAYNPITKQEGDSISICYAFENISTYDFDDTLQVKYTITNSNGISRVSTAKLTKLKKDSVITFCYKFSTAGLHGSNILQAYVNPKILREEYYNNNIIEMAFNVDKDVIHPILDVAFDGTHIMDGDIVSPSPMITITLNDENKYLIRTTTDNMEVYLQKPNNTIPQPVSLTGSDIVSARQIGTNGKNVFQIEYNPKGLPDGIYTLDVRGKDLSDNASGVLDYKITFEVINESTITNFYPYPNPFSSSTRFVFTLTGSEIPQDMKIQIMTVTGKVVREITKAEIGPIRIGNNKTEFAWDGTDEFGDKLANGVYLYRVILKNGGDFKHRDTAGDKAFKKNFGKLYILR